MVSIPRDVFEKAERLVRRMKKSGNQSFSHAVAERVARHTTSHVTEIVGRVLSEIGVETDLLVSAASRRLPMLSE